MPSILFSLAHRRRRKYTLLRTKGYPLPTRTRRRHRRRYRLRKLTYKIAANERERKLEGSIFAFCWRGREKVSVSRSCSNRSEITLGTNRRDTYSGEKWLSCGELPIPPNRSFSQVQNRSILVLSNVR
jgi:hypothetical protein